MNDIVRDKKKVKTTTGKTVFDTPVADETFSAVRAKTPKPGVLTFLKRLVGFYPRKGPVALEKSDRDTPITLDWQPLPHRSFLSFVPFTHYDHPHQQIIKKDKDGNITKRAVFLEILPTDIEAREEDYIDTVADKIALSLQAIPGQDKPWIIQVYINDEPIRSLIHEIRQYGDKIDKKNKPDSHFDRYRETWFALLDKHFKLTSRREGIFVEKYTGMPWRSRYRRTRMVIYKNDADVDPDILNAQVLRLVEALAEAGIHTMRRNSEDLHEWLMPWYSGDREKAYAHMEAVPYPLEDEKLGNLPAGHDIGEMCLRGRYVTASAEKRAWVFGKRLNRFITLEPLRRVPKSAHWNRESAGGAAPFDRLPDGAILMNTIVVQPQDKIEGEILLTKGASIGDSEDSRLTEEECDEALSIMAHGHRLNTVFSGIYIDAQDEKELERRTATTIAAAIAANFDVIEPDTDPLILDSYVRGLPMAFEHELDARSQKRARKAWEQHTARLLPFYNRGRGTEHPGWIFSSRDGEPTLMDPLGEDRTKNAHMFMLGGTGSGKTSTLISMLLQTMAIHKPRLFLITALPTFYLLGDFFEEQGLTVNRVQVTSNNLPSLPPFAEITQAIIDRDNEHTDDEPVKGDNTEVRKRNIIGEAEVAANLMITGGDPKEEQYYRAQDKALVKQGIIHAAETVLAEGRDQALTEDIAKALRDLSNQDGRSHIEREILAKYATIIDSFCSGMEGKLFNRAGENWPDADVTIIELGELADEGNETNLAVAMAGLMAKINHVVVSNQYSGRDTITVGDEGHILFKNPLIGPLLNTKIAMWRTFGGWFWFATQNLRQLPESALELVNQPEWWVCLNTGKDEIEQIAKFKTLTDEQKNLLDATRKEKGKYIEGVVFSKTLLTLIRNTPPGIALALAETESDEKAHRFELMQQHGCSELEAVYLRAEEINNKRKEHNYETDD